MIDEGGRREGITPNGDFKKKRLMKRDGEY